MKDKNIYLLGVYFTFGELSIMGIFTDKKKLLSAYDKLMTEDARCKDSKNPKIPNIYKIPINEFLGQDFPWNRTEEGEVRFYEEEKIESITVDEISSQIS